MTRRSGFTVVEALLALGLAGLLFAGLLSAFSDTLRRFVQGEDTLTGVRDAQSLLGRLRADISRAATPATGNDPSVSPSTGTTYPKHVVHVCHGLDASALTLYPFRIGADPEPFPGDHPLAARLGPGPGSALALARIARAHDATVWVEGEAATEDDPRWFVVNVLDGSTYRRVTWSFVPRERTVIRDGPDGRHRYATGGVVGFRAVPHLEILVPPAPARVEVLKLWVEVRLELQAPDEASGGIDKRLLTLQTRMVPRPLNAWIHGASGL